MEKNIIVRLMSKQIYLLNLCIFLQHAVLFNTQQVVKDRWYTKYYTGWLCSKYRWCHNIMMSSS